MSLFGYSIIKNNKLQSLKNENNALKEKLSIARLLPPDTVYVIEKTDSAEEEIASLKEQLQEFQKKVCGRIAKTA